MKSLVSFNKMCPAACQLTCQLAVMLQYHEAHVACRVLILSVLTLIISLSVLKKTAFHMDQNKHNKVKLLYWMTDIFVTSRVLCLREIYCVTLATLKILVRIISISFGLFMEIDINNWK